MIEDQAARMTESTALIMSGQKITYKELNSSSNQLAHFLRDQNVRCENLVGVCLDRSLDSIVSLLAILKSGGSYLPLDPNFLRIVCLDRAMENHKTVLDELVLEFPEMS